MRKFRENLICKQLDDAMEQSTKRLQYCEVIVFLCMRKPQSVVGTFRNLLPSSLYNDKSGYTSELGHSRH